MASAATRRPRAPRSRRATCGGGAGARTPTPPRRRRTGSPGCASGSAATGRRSAAPVALEDVRLRAPQLPAGVRERLVGLAGAEGVRDDRAARVLHAAGKGYPDLVRHARRRRRAGARRGRAPRRRTAQVRACCARARRPASPSCPFGGGTSVVGGVEPLRGGFSAVIVARPGAAGRGCCRVDERSRRRSSPPGLRGPAVEAALARARPDARALPAELRVRDRRRLRRDALGRPGVDGLRPHRRAGASACAAPRRPATLDLAARPPAPPGRTCASCVVGSEGDARRASRRSTLRVRPRPRGHALRGLHAALVRRRRRGAPRAGPAAASRPTSRGSPTRPRRSCRCALAGRRRAQGRASARGYLRARGVADGCLAIVGWEGDGRARAHGAARRRRRCCGRHGAVALGQAPGRAWAKRPLPRRPTCATTCSTRGVHGRDARDRGAWSTCSTLLPRRSATRCRRHAPLVACHVSHLYPSGASLYFTFLAAAGARRRARQWRAAKPAASDAIVAAGGTITHHHAVGRDHARGCARRWATAASRCCARSRSELDPAGIMNPGKLLPG